MPTAGSSERPSTDGSTARSLSVLGVCRARVAGTTLRLTPAAKRLLALVAVTGPMSRSRASALLWPDTDSTHAAANLRTTLARLNAVDARFVEASGDVLALYEEIALDVDLLTTWIDSCIYDEMTVTSIPNVEPPPHEAGVELLPGWEDEWTVQPREHLRLLQSQALERVAETLLANSRTAEAMPYALLAVQIQPWSESATRMLIEIHARRGDSGNALRRYRRFRDDLRRELGIEPGPAITSVVRQLLPFADLTGPETTRE